MTGVLSGSRRDRVRASTVEEIKHAARRLLRDEGQAGMSLRAIARDMGMSAPALYRYFPSHEELTSALVCDLYGELADVLVAVREALPADAVQSRLIHMAFAFRDWSVLHPREFSLVFGTPLPSLTTMSLPHEDRPEHLAGMRFGMVFTEAFLGLWQVAPFPVPGDDELPPGLVVQLVAYRETLAEIVPGADAVPLGAIHTFLESWVQLYGMVAMEVFEHLHFCLADVGPFFQATMHRLAMRLGMDPADLLRLKTQADLGTLAEVRARLGLPPVHPSDVG